MASPPHKKRPDTETRDRNLCDRLSQGDEAAYEEIISLHAAALLSFGHRLRLSQQAAEDVLQATFMAILENIHAFRRESSLKTWIFSIYYHKAIGEIKANLKLTLSEDIDGLSDQFDTTGHWIKKPSAWGENPEAKMLSDELYQMILTCSEGIKPLPRSVFYLRDQEELSAQEICKILAISETNFWVLLHRARTKIRDCVDRALKRH